MGKMSIAKVHLQVKGPDDLPVRVWAPLWLRGEVLGFMGKR
jgi:hypothetical protein